MMDISTQAGKHETNESFMPLHKAEALIILARTAKDIYANVSGETYANRCKEIAIKSLGAAHNILVQS